MLYLVWVFSPRAAVHGFCNCFRFCFVFFDLFFVLFSKLDVVLIYDLSLFCFSSFFRDSIIFHIFTWPFGINILVELVNREYMVCITIYIWCASQYIYLLILRIIILTTFLINTLYYDVIIISRINNTGENSG